MIEPRLYAVTPGGPVRAEVPAGAGSVHELFDAFPLGVYSGLRTFRHERFLRLDLHIARARENLRAKGWPSFDEDLLRGALHATCSEWPGPDARVRFDVLGAEARIGAAAGRVWIALSELTLPAPELVRDGVRIELTRELARPNPRVKHTDFVVRRRPHPIGTRERFELVMLDEAGRLLEGTTSNFWAVKDGVLRTADAGVLEGVTRHILLELASGLGIPVLLEAVASAELGELDEAFISSSSRGLVPVVEIADARVGTGRPGPTSLRLLTAYTDYAEREARPALDAPEARRERAGSPRRD